MPRTQKLLPITGSKSDEGRLTIEHRNFVDALLRTGDKVRAYIEIYGEKKNKKVAMTNADRLLTRAEIQEELRARYAEMRLTKPWLLMNLMEIAKKRSDKGGASAAVNSMRLIAEMCGYVDEMNLNQVFFGNIIVNFPPVYNQDEAVKFIKEGRICE